MALRVRRRVLRAPWWIVGGILLAAALVVAALVRVVVAQESADHEAIAAEAASAVTQELTLALSGFYTPTVAAEGFAASMRAEADSLGVNEADVLEATWPTYAAPLAENLGDALLDFQLAPEAIVTYSARPEENAAALGHNQLVDDERRDQIIAAIEARGPVISGPLDLLQGGRGLIIRQAVFLPGLRPFEERFAERSGDTTAYPWLDRIPDDFWGMTTTVIDFDALTSLITMRGAPGTQVGVFVPQEDGSLGEPVWGDLPADSAITNQQTVTLLDGSEWVVRVNVPTTPWAHYWPVLLIALFTTALIIALTEFAYRAQRRNKIGFAFSESMSDLTTRQDVLERTSTFLTDLYPGITGVITSPEQHACEVAIPIDGTRGTSSRRDNTSGSELQWQILQSQEVQCVISVDADGPFHPRELDQIIGLIRRILGASLAALGRERRLERRVAVDHLTEVFNRTQLVPTLERLHEEAARSETWLVLACLDIDDFKGVNDTRGHLFGDEVLKTLAGTLKESVRASDAVVRFGGDEFVVIAGVDDTFQAADLCRRIQQQATNALSALGGEPLSVSLGYATVPGREPATVEGLLQQADAALYEAKESGGAHVREGHPL